MDLRRKIEGVDVITSENEVWFLQDEKICWTTREELWSESSRLSQVLREKGYRIHAQRFPRKLREFVLTLSKSDERLI